MTEGRGELEVIPAADWTDAVADAMATRIAAQADLVLCLPTGSTPRPVYERLPAALARPAHPWPASRSCCLTNTWACRPVIRSAATRSSSASSRRRRPRFVTFDVDGPDPATACATYDAAIVGLGGLDLVVLGLGANGHVGMNEPGTLPDAPTRVIDLAPSTMAAARAYGADPPPTRGVTLGLAGILAAREIWLLVSGDRKAAILRASRARSRPTCRRPCFAATRACGSSRTTRPDRLFL